MDEKVLEEIRFHQDVLDKDASSPLYQIREKEMEISGRVLAAKNQAEKVVAEARKKATEIVQQAELEAERLAKEQMEKSLKEAEKEAASIRAGAAGEAKKLEEELSGRKAEAVDFVVRMVTTA
ncbi:MAG: hypothetical protein Kow0067_05800 [Coriobacteriia bacterium]